MPIFIHNYLYIRPISYTIGYQGETKYKLSLRFIHNWVIMGIQWMVRLWVLVHYGPHPSLHMQTFWIRNKELFVLYTWKGAASPYFSVLHFQIIIVICLVFFDPCPYPVSASGTDDTPSMAPCVCRIKSVGFFFRWRILLFSLSGKSFICKIYGDHPYEDLDNSGYNPYIKIK